MCVSMGPAAFTGAIAFGGEVSNDLHLLGYQNSAQSLAGANCMLLHVPTAELTAGSLISTTADRGFMNDMASRVHSLVSQSRSSLMFRGGADYIPKGIVVQYGAYEIVLANSASDIPEALERVSPAKRPAINSELLGWYDQNFPFYSFILACFNNAVEEASHPILVQYTPLDPTTIFVPGLESHSGRPPVLGGRDHERDLKVVFGSRLAAENSQIRPVRYTNPLNLLRHLLPASVVGFRDEGFGTNSDYIARVEDVRSGVSHAQLFKTMSAHTAGLTQSDLALLGP